MDGKTRRRATIVQLVLAVDIGGALPMKRASERIWVRKEKCVGVSDARADCVMVRLAQNEIGVVEVKRPTYATIDIGEYRNELVRSLARRT